jgi:hypothetical protein
LSLNREEALSVADLKTFSNNLDGNLRTRVCLASSRDYLALNCPSTKKGEEADSSTLQVGWSSRRL